jgi:serine/threonine-protein kinase
MSGRFPEPGKIFEEKYRVERLLGSGGFARVYLAEQTDLGRMVAIKILSPKVSRAAGEEQTDPKIESVALRFEREARVVSQLRSPQTVTMYDYGRTESGLLYMVMEYVDGTELDEISVPIEPRRVVKILKQMLQSLHEAHAHGLLHRDLKPANIMVFEHLGEKDQVKLLDFGIAKAVGEAADDGEQDLTADNSLIGTPRYMSPEQIRGADVGPASDIYSLGLVAYELLMGEKAITNTDSIEILGRHLSSESFEIPRHHAIHPSLRRLINKMLAKNLEGRYSTTKEVLQDIAEIERIDGDLRVGGGPPPTPGDDSVDDDIYAVLDDDDLEFHESEAVAGSAQGSRTGLVAAIIAVLLISAGVVGWQMIGAANTKGVPIDEDEASAGEASAGLEADEPNPEQGDPVQADSELADSEQAGASKPDASAPVVVTLIRTRPEGASVWLGETLAGMSPVQFQSTDHEFPLTVRAKLGERSVEKTLDLPGGEIFLELPDDEDLTAAGSKPSTTNERPTQGRVNKGAGASASKASGRDTKSTPKKTHPEKNQPEQNQNEEPDEEPDEDDNDDTRTYLPLE